MHLLINRENAEVTLMLMDVDLRIIIAGKMIKQVDRTQENERRIRVC